MEHEPTCAFCDRPPAAYCRRCGRGYCPAHGGAFCQECSVPASALPSPRLFQAVLFGLPVFAAIGLFFLFTSPSLPGDHPAPSQATATIFGPSSLPPATATPAVRTYFIQQGDTLQSIATRYSTTVQEIEQLNPGLTADNLPVGQAVRIPPATP
jgi:hypothetical protein